MNFRTFVSVFVLPLCLLVKHENGGDDPILRNSSGLDTKGTHSVVWL